MTSVAVPAAAWSISGALGWLVFVLLGGPGLTGPALVVLFAVAALLAAGLAIGLTRLLGDRGLAGVPGWVALVVVGWGVANTTGWTLAVEVGGPLLGLAVALAVAGAAVEATTGVTVRRTVLVAVAALVAVLVSRLVLVDVWRPLGLLVTVVVAVAAVAAGRWALVPALPLTPVVVLVAANGVAWLGAWAVSSPAYALVGAYGSMAVEIVLAVALGAAVLGVCQHGPDGEPVGRVLLRWTAAAAAGFVLAVLVAVLAAAVLPARPGAEPGALGFMDVGTTIGLAATAWYSCRPTIGRPLRWSQLTRKG